MIVPDPPTWILHVIVFIGSLYLGYLGYKATNRWVDERESETSSE